MVGKLDELFRKPVCEPTDESAVRRLEERLGVPLPASYRGFLLSHNGGYVVSGSGIDFWDGDWKDTLPLLSLLALCDEGEYDSIQEHLRMYVEDSRIMRSFLPIGACGTGDKICLKIKGEKVGSVYGWIFEEEQEPEDVEAENEAGWANMYLLAEGFDEFIEKILIGPIEYE